MPVVEFPSQATPDEILRIARKTGFKDLIVCGYDEEGDFRFGNSKTDAGKLLLILELAKAAVLEDVLEEEEDE